MKEFLKILREILEFIRKNKEYWLIPVIITLFIFGFLIATAGNSSVPVFVYPLV